MFSFRSNDVANPTNNDWHLINTAQNREVKLSCLQENINPQYQFDISKLASIDNLDEISSRNISDLYLVLQDERTAAKLKEQYDDTILWPYIHKLKYLNPDHSSPIPFLNELPTQLQFVNLLGRDQFRFLSLSEIREHILACKTKLIEVVEIDQRRVLLLTAFSLIREAAYKTDMVHGDRWPSAIEVLAILSQINYELSEHNKNIPNFLMRMAGEKENQSFIAVFIGILTWLQGGSVSIVTENDTQALAEAKKFAPLFASLGIPCQYLQAELHMKDIVSNQTKENTYEHSEHKYDFTGVYFAAFRELAIIRQQRLLYSGKDIQNMSFVLCNVNEIIFENTIEYCLIQSDRDEHPHAWIFERLAEFIERVSPQNTSHSYKLSDVVNYLRDVNPMGAMACDEMTLLSRLPAYLQSAWLAKEMKEGVDYVLKPRYQDDEYYATVLTKDKFSGDNLPFNGLIQHALHGYLNYKARKNQSSHYFSIPSEAIVYSSLTAESILQWMSQSGKLIAMSANLESIFDVLEMEYYHGFNILKLPKLQAEVHLNDKPFLEIHNPKHALLDYETKSAKHLHRRIKSITISQIQAHFYDLWLLANHQMALSEERCADLLGAFVNVLGKINTILPLEDFSKTTIESITARYEYNKEVVAIYQDALLIYEAVLRDIIPDSLEDVIYTLLNKIEIQQQDLLSKYHQVLAVCSAEPALKKYKAIPLDTPISSYPDTDKQSSQGYLYSKFGYFFTPDANMSKAELVKKSEEERIAHKKSKKYDFITQLMQMVSANTLTKGLLNIYLNIYSQLMTVDTEAKQVSALSSIDIYQPKVASANWHLGKDSVITFVRDPLIGTVCQVSLVSSDFKMFSRLQASIANVYSNYSIEPALPFQVDKFDEANLYYVVIDFSGHQFDSLNRNSLLSDIGKVFGCNLDKLLKTKIVPSDIAMQSTLTELYDKLNESMGKPVMAVYAAINAMRKSTTRYDKTLEFRTAYLWLKNNIEIFNSETKVFISAFLNYDLLFQYQDEHGVLCHAYPPPFASLSDLMENENKRLALEVLNRQLVILEKDVLKHAPLVRQQMDCFRSLGILIARSPANTTLASIYDNWQTTKLVFQSTSFSVNSLMQKQAEEVWFFGRYKSMDVSLICQEIEKIANDQCDKLMQRYASR